MAMIQQHRVVMSNAKYRDGLRVFECRDCDYAFMAELGPGGVMDPTTRVPVNHGDLQAVHTIFQVPRIDLELNVGADIDMGPDGLPDC